MKNEVIVTAKTVDEAMAQARRQYGSSENELAFEILEMPKKGFLGIGAKDAMLKVSVNEVKDVDLGSLVSDLLHGRENLKAKSGATHRFFCIKF